MALFETNRPSITKLLALILLSLALMAFDRAGSSWADRLNLGLGSVTDGMTRLLHAPGHWLHELSSDLESRSVLSQRVAQLEKQNLLLKGQMQRYFELQNENQQLRQLLHGRERVPQDILLARYLGKNPLPEKHTFTIDRGLQDGVMPGQAVIDGHGLIGQILRSTMTGATVIELISKQHAVSVDLDDTGFVGILNGTGERDRLTMGRIPDRYPVKVGDLLTTSGLDGVFPRGYPVARVTQVNDDQRHAFINIVARPLANLDHLDQMLVLTQAPGKSTAPQPRRSAGITVNRPVIPMREQENTTQPTVAQHAAQNDKGHAR